MAEAVDRLAEEISALIAGGEEPEVVAIAAEELRLMRLGVPVEEQEPLPEPDTPEGAELVAKGRAASKLLQGVSIGDLMPTEEQLNADPKLEAWFAGLSAPPPRLSFGTSPAAPKRADVTRAVRVESRPRERRVRAGRSTARSPGRPSADDDADLERRRREAVAA